MTTKTKVHTVYKTSDGEKVPSVTTILGVLAKPALIEWAYQCGLKGEDYRKVRDDAASVGTLAHLMIMHHLRGTKPDLSEFSSQDIERAENCLIKYWDWEKGHKIEPLLIEDSLVSEINGYGGTIDFFGLVDDVPTLVDFKTGKKIYDEFLYQLAAYDRLLIEFSYNAKVIKILRIGRDAEEGFEEMTAGNLDKQWDIFWACKKIYETKKEIK